MRSFSKNKFSLCFRPVVDIDAMLKSKVASHRSEKKAVLKFSKTVLKVLKTVVLETILNRRARLKNCYGLDCFGDSKNERSTYKKETKATESSLSTLSSDNLYFSSTKVSQSKNMSTKKEQKKGNRGSTLLEKQMKFEFYAMCLILISLAFTVFWGKLVGILWTSIFLYFFSLSNSNYSSHKKLFNCPRYSVQYSIQCKDGCKGSLWKVFSK